MTRKRLVILGGGESGTGAALLGRKAGYEVWLSDAGQLKDKYRNVLLNAEIPFEEKGHTAEIILQADEVVKSPGIPDTAPLIQKLKSANIPVISEIEFAGRYNTAKTVCITGSNGKTTTTLLTGHIFRKAGFNVAVGGNVGKSFAGLVTEGGFEVCILELSSFQLDGLRDFSPDAGILLNITPDHLDRYENDFNRYAESKMRIATQLKPGASFLYNADDPEIRHRLDRVPEGIRMIPFSLKDVPKGEGAWIRDNEMNINLKPNRIKMTLENLALQGKHNLYNSMAASVAARIFDIRKEIIKESLSDFQNVPHRLEYVARIHGVEFINDSKATNVNATWYALESMQGKVVWIAGGIDKGNDYSLLRELVREKVKAIICLGTDNKNLIKAFKKDVDQIFETRSMTEAVGMGLHLAGHDETVLLSPACASFDLFENYEDRGNAFKAAVNRL
ncbi:MAG: UDP-N-acetylmuramoyl-L-alanine--D-glutamate ligase [Bacteroidales bacterium]